MLEVDFMARRYGVRPSEFLKTDSSFEFLFDLMACQLGVEEEKRLRRKQEPKRG